MKLATFSVLGIVTVFVLGIASVAVYKWSPRFEDNYEMDQDRIIGSSPGNQTGYNFVVAIKVNSQLHCGGFVYNSRWILTAATCTFNQQASSFQIIAGTNSTSNTIGAQIRSVSQFRNHPDFDIFTSKNNIALLQLSTALTLGSNVNFGPIDDPVDPLNGTLIGWGATQNGGSPTGRLQEAKVNLLDDSICETYDPNYDSSLMMCTKGQTATAACQGDAGDPLVQDNGNVIGLLSHIKDCNPANPAYHTRIGSFLGWIQSVAGVQNIL